jgi:hypothetical protein
MERKASEWLYQRKVYQLPTGARGKIEEENGGESPVKSLSAYARRDLRTEDPGQPYKVSNQLCRPPL